MLDMKKSELKVRAQVDGIQCGGFHSKRTEPTNPNSNLKRLETLQPFNNLHHRWFISWSGATGGIHCPCLKIYPRHEGNTIGVMKFGKDYECEIPFLRFHLGTAPSEWLVIKNPNQLDNFSTRQLKDFLGKMGKQEANGRTTAIIGQMLLNRFCAIQIGNVMMLLIDVKDELINPLCLTFNVMMLRTN